MNLTAKTGLSVLSGAAFLMLYFGQWSSSRQSDHADKYHVPCICTGADRPRHQSKRNLSGQRCQLRMRNGGIHCSGLLAGSVDCQRALAATGSNSNANGWIALEIL